MSNTETTKAVRFHVGSNVVWAAPSVVDVEKTIQAFAKWLESNTAALEANYKDITPSLTTEQELIAKQAAVYWFNRTKNAKAEKALLVSVITDAILSKSGVEYADQFEKLSAVSKMNGAVDEWLTENSISFSKDEDTVARNGEIFESKRGKGGGINLIDLKSLREQVGTLSK